MKVVWSDEAAFALIALEMKLAERYSVEKAAAIVETVPRRKRKPARKLVAIVVVGVVAAVVVPAFDERVTKCGSAHAGYLKRIERRAWAYFHRYGTFPVGRSSALPPWSCCPQKCGRIPVQAWAEDPIWAALGFGIDGPIQGQLSYKAPMGERSSRNS